jgi:hypothetical protein
MIQECYQAGILDAFCYTPEHFNPKLEEWNVVPTNLLEREED